MSIKARAVQLPRLLSLLPKNGVGSLVYQNRWSAKGFTVPTSPPTIPSDSCHYEVKKVDITIKENGNVRGNAWGVKVWKGKQVTPEGTLEPISGGMKHLWQAANPPLTLQQIVRQEPKEASTPPTEGDVQQA